MENTPQAQHQHQAADDKLNDMLTKSTTESSIVNMDATSSGTPQTPTTDTGPTDADPIVSGLRHIEDLLIQCSAKTTDEANVNTSVINGTYR